MAGIATGKPRPIWLEEERQQRRDHQTQERHDDLVAVEPGQRDAQQRQLPRRRPDPDGRRECLDRPHADPLLALGGCDRADGVRPSLGGRQSRQSFGEIRLGRHQAGDEQHDAETEERPSQQSNLQSGGHAAPSLVTGTGDKNLGIARPSAMRFIQTSVAM
jgi:hypothetical protein